MLMRGGSLAKSHVALRKESVDRNDSFDVERLPDPSTSLSARRAWIEIIRLQQAVNDMRSLSARRAWIEIEMWCHSLQDKWQSLSARRAWIEMLIFALLTVLNLVALRKESVDRNIFSLPLVLIFLKSLSARRAWIEIY